jgi:hypothetical protein
MNSFLTRDMSNFWIGELRRAARRRRSAEGYTELDESSLTVRAFQPDDTDAVRVLAALDGKHVPTGPALVAEVDREVVAALPLDGGQALADPFRPTAHLVELLKVRADQLRARTV